MTIQIATAWQAGEFTGGTPSGSYSTSGKLSFFYEAGSNLITSVIFYEENNAALFSAIVPIQIAWPNNAGSSPTSYIGREADGHPPLRFINLKNKKFLILKIREVIAVTPAAGTAPTLDHFTGRISGTITNGTWTMAFDSTGNTTRTTVA